MTTEHDLLETWRPLDPQRKLALRASLLAGVRAHRRQPRRRLAVRLSVALAAGIALALSFTLNAGPSLTAWSTVPDRLSAAALNSAMSQCRIELSHVPIFAGLPPSGPNLIAIGEQRGTTTSIAMADGRTVGICIGTEQARFAGIEPLVASTPASILVVDDAQSGQASGPGATRFAFGRIGPNVATVEVTTTDGRTVIASTSGPYFLAWWPSGADAATITAYDQSGQVIDTDHPAAARSTVTPIHRS
ncbi:MAG TPA: hypothetical protein VGS97_10500 [Actinocrinis sp.]|uniref:hypothetical protein n=1 Tax=Actinocrinis sp. TaxID=1920516 RepID=UPI002DDD5BB3|nr:hypothetical protein [Actinocrinis sp.]HEV2344511.1 hypothetical protein [Actinocrinis sp.]